MVYYHTLLNISVLTYRLFCHSATQKYYAAEAQLMDFAMETEKSRIAINKWIEDQTEQKIKDLLQPGIIDTDTAMVLANAIYFKGKVAQ